MRESKQQRDEAQRIVDDLKGTSATTTEKGLVQLSSDTDNDSEELAATSKPSKSSWTRRKQKHSWTARRSQVNQPHQPAGRCAVGLEMANAAFVRKLLAALVDSSPEAPDTERLAAALGNDELCDNNHERAGR